MRDRGREKLRKKMRSDRKKQSCPSALEGRCGKKRRLEGSSPQKQALLRNGIAEHLAGLPGKDQKAYPGPP